jgi:hypothetical protein
MPQPVEIDGVLVATSDRRRTRHYHLEHCVPDALRIASIRHRFRKPPAHPELALHSSQQQQRVPSLDVLEFDVARSPAF